MKLLFLGFDGLDYNDVEKFIPSFKRGVYGISYPEKGFALTGPSWSSIYTGVKRDKHKVMHVWGLKGKESKIEDSNIDNIESVRLVDSTYKPIWKLVDSSYKVGVVGMPLTYPAIEVNGFMIPGYPSLRNFSTHPIFVRDLLLEKYYIDFVEVIMKNEESFMANNYTKKVIELYNDGILDHFIRGLEYKRIDKVFELIDRFDTEILFIQFPFVDHISHCLNFEDNDVCRMVYDVVKDLLDKLELLNPDNVFIISDHGRPAQDSWHTINGFYCMYKTDQEYYDNYRVDINNIDICPTILELLGLQYNESDFDGNAIETRIESEEIKARLKGLGYM